MADKIARCPASANTSNATLPPSLCSRSIVDDVYTADVPLAFLTVIYAPPLLRYFVSLSILLRFYHPRYSLPSRFWHRSFPSHACNTRTLPLRRIPRPLGFRHSQHIHFSPHCSFRGLSHAPLPSLSFPTFFILSLAHSSSACSMFLASFTGCLGPLWFPPLVHSFHAVFLIIRRCSALLFDRRWIFLPL